MQSTSEIDKRKEARVIPIILRPCKWQDTPIGKLQALPSSGEAVSKWPDRDDAFLSIVQGIRKVIRELKQFPPDLVNEKISSGPMRQVNRVLACFGYFALLTPILSILYLILLIEPLHRAVPTILYSIDFAFLPIWMVISAVFLFLKESFFLYFHFLQTILFLVLYISIVLFLIYIYFPVFYNITNFIIILVFYAVLGHLACITLTITLILASLGRYPRLPIIGNIARKAAIRLLRKKHAGNSSKLSFKLGR